MPRVADITRSFLMRPQLELYKREAMSMWEQDGSVSIYVPEGYRKGIATGIALGLERICKKGTIPGFARKHEWTDCISRYCKLSGFGSSPYRFPWFGATFKTKERLTRRLLQQHFCRSISPKSPSRSSSVTHSLVAKPAMVETPHIKHLPTSIHCWTKRTLGTKCPICVVKTALSTVLNSSFMDMSWWYSRSRHCTAWQLSCIVFNWQVIQCTYFIFVKVCDHCPLPHKIHPPTFYTSHSHKSMTQARLSPHRGHAPSVHQVSETDSFFWFLIHEVPVHFLGIEKFSNMFQFGHSRLKLLTFILWYKAVCFDMFRIISQYLTRV